MVIDNKEYATIEDAAFVTNNLVTIQDILSNNKHT